MCWLLRPNPRLGRVGPGNEAIFKRILDDEEFRQVLMDLYAGRVYQKARRLPEEQ